jgi:hypothetical protein
MPLWANLHGAFVVGLGLLAVEFAAAAWRRDGRGMIRFMIVRSLSLVGLLANPWGARVLAYAVLLPANRVVTGMVSEWAPASLRDPAGAMLLVSVGVLVVAVARSPQARASVWFGLALPVALCTWPGSERRGWPGLTGAVRWPAAWCSSRWR